MTKVVAEQEHYLLVSDGDRFTFVERRAGQFYPLCNGARHGLQLDDATSWYANRAHIPSGMAAAAWPMLLRNGGIYANTSDEMEWGANRNAHADRLG